MKKNKSGGSHPKKDVPLRPIMEKKIEDITPYGNDKAKKEQVKDMFDNIAGTYDLLNKTLSFGIDRLWRKTMLKHLRKTRATKILDVATGTGDVAIAIAQKINNSTVMAVDLSPGMLKIGEEKVKKAGLTAKIALQEEDCENLSFDTDVYDAATVAFGVRNFEHLEQGLSEMHRVLKKDGRIFVLEFSKPKTFPFKQLFNTYFRYVLPTAGKLMSKDDRAYRYLFESATAFPEGDEFTKILEKVGFENAICKPLTFGICSLYIAKK